MNTVSKRNCKRKYYDVCDADSNFKFILNERSIQVTIYTWLQFKKEQKSCIKYLKSICN